MLSNYDKHRLNVLGQRIKSGRYVSPFKYFLIWLVIAIAFVAVVAVVVVVSLHLILSTL